MNYQSPATAAPNIEILIDYLSSLEKQDGPFIYRGQIKDWPTPLIPSLYRRSICRNRILTHKDSEYKHCLRHCGNQFIEMKPDSYLEKLTYDVQGITYEEAQGIRSLSSNPKFASIVATSGYETALSKWTKPEYISCVLERCDIWARILDEWHRGIIRQFGFMQPFGFMLGLTLAQQYGLSSELLDFTSNILIAAFFSTHDSPYYKFEGTNLPKRIGTDIGVIYRLPSNIASIKYKRIDSFNYYNSPSQIHLSDLCIPFENNSEPSLFQQMYERFTFEDKVGALNYTVPFRFYSAMEVAKEIEEDQLSLSDAVDKYLSLYYQFGTGNIRYYRLLRLRPGTFMNSRLGRQSAVMIVPDELRITKHFEPWEEKLDYALFQAVEDIKYRAGFEKFYFHHSDKLPDLGGITREYLWPPEEDVFKFIISRVLDPSTKQYWFGENPVLKRIDLVSSGYACE